MKTVMKRLIAGLLALILTVTGLPAAPVQAADSDTVTFVYGNLVDSHIKSITLKASGSDTVLETVSSSTSTISSQTYEFHIGTDNTLAVAERPGYEFRGWQKRGASGISFPVSVRNGYPAVIVPDGATMRGVTELLAVWRVKTYTVHYKKENGTKAADDTTFSWDEVDALEEAALAVPSSAPEDGTQFTGWKSTTGAVVTGRKAELKALDTDGDRELTVESAYEQITYHLHYVDALAVTGGSVSFLYDSAHREETLSLPTQAALCGGGRLLGWSLYPDNDPERILTGDVITKGQCFQNATLRHEVLLYPVYEGGTPTHRVILDAGDGGVFPENMSIPRGGVLDAMKRTVTLRLAEGETISGLSALLPERTGYDFTGWRDTRMEDVGNAITMGTADLSLYADWEAVVYCVHYRDLNDSGYGDRDVSPQELSYTESITLAVPDEDYAKVGYVFLGWATGKADGYYATAIVQNSEVYARAFATVNGGKLYKAGDELKGKDAAGFAEGTAVYLRPVWYRVSYHLRFHLTKEAGLRDTNIRIVNEQEKETDDLWWEKNGHYYDLVYYQGTGTFLMSSVLPYLKEETAPGFVFAGWYVNGMEDAEHRISAIDTQRKLEAPEEGIWGLGDYELYPVWRPVRYLIEYHYGDEVYETCSEVQYQSIGDAGNFKLLSGGIFYDYGGYAFSAWKIGDETYPYQNSGYPITSLFDYRNGAFTPVAETDAEGAALTDPDGNPIYAYRIAATALTKPKRFSIRYVNAPVNAVKYLADTYETTPAASMGTPSARYILPLDGTPEGPMYKEGFRFDGWIFTDHLGEEQLLNAPNLDTDGNGIADTCVVPLWEGIPLVLTAQYTEEERSAPEPEPPIDPETAYTIVLKRGDTEALRLLVPEEKMTENTTLSSAVLAKEKNFIRQQTLGGTHFEGKVEFQDQKLDWTTLSLAKVKAAADTSRTTEITLVLIPNTYRVYYEIRLQDGSYETADPLDTTKPGVGAENREFLYGSTYYMRFGKTSAWPGSFYKDGTLSGWRVQELVPKKDADGLPYDLQELYAAGGFDALSGKYTMHYGQVLAPGDSLTDLTDRHHGLILLYAEYTPKRFQISFAPGVPRSSAVVTGEMKDLTLTADSEDWTKKLRPVTYRAKGFQCVGWSPNGAYGTKIYGFDTTWEALIRDLNYPEHITLTAIWEPESYTITYYPEGGKLPEKQFDRFRTYTVQGLFNIPNPVSEQGNGYTFGGWYYDSALKKKVLVQGSGTDARAYIPAGTTGNLKLYASWIPKTLTIRYHANDGTDQVMEETTAYNALTALPKAPWKVKGMKFAGWSTEEKGKVPSYVMNVSQRFTKDMDLYAVWAEKDRSTFQVTLSLNGVKATIPAIERHTMLNQNQGFTYRYGESFALPKPVPEDSDNYHFSHWVDENGKKIKRITKKTVGNHALTAVWTVKKYQIHYWALSPAGSKVTGLMKPQRVAYNAYWIPAECSYMAKGYRFAGWSAMPYQTEADPEYNNTSDTAFTYRRFTRTKDLNLFAVWEAVPGEVTLLTDPKVVVGHSEIAEGSDRISAETGTAVYTYTYHQIAGKVTLPGAESLHLDGMRFAGWTKAAKNQKGEYVAASSGKVLKNNQIPAGNTGVYAATWTGTYTIHYENPLTGKEIRSKELPVGKKTAVSDLPKEWKREGYLFAGWSLESPNLNDTGADIRSGQRIAPDWEDLSYLDDQLSLTLYAVLEPKEKSYRVNFFTDAGFSSSKTFRYKNGLSAAKLTEIGKKTAEKEGRVFEAWLDADGRTIRSLPKKTAGTVNLYLKSRQNDTIRLTFKKNAPEGVSVKGKVADKTIKTKKTGEVNLISGVNSYRAKGYVLKGYATAENPEYGIVYALEPNGKLDAGAILSDHDVSRLTLYAVWEAPDQQWDYYNYYFDPAGGTLYTVDDVTELNVLYGPEDAAHNPGAGQGFYYMRFLNGVMPRPSRLGYRFDGWKAVNTAGRTRYFKAKWKEL